MKIKNMVIISLLFILGFLMAVPGLQVTRAAPETRAISSTWNVISNGGTSFTTNGKYTLGATIGQSPSGLLSVSGKMLNVGFWLQGLFDNFLPLLIR